LRQSASLCNAEASSLALVDEKNSCLRFEVSIGSSSDIVESMSIPMGQGIIGWVIENDKEVIIDDCSKDSRFYGGVDEATSFVTKSILAVPMKTKRGVIGGIELLNKKEGRKFSEEDLKIIKALSTQAALAIENAKLYESILEEKNRVTSIIEAIGDGIIVTDEDGRVIMMNPVAERVWSRENIV